MRSADRAFGPGVADMKGGAVVAAMAVEAAIKTAGLETTNVIVLCNTDEEIGSVESRSVIIDKAQGADLSLVFEPARPDGSIVTARRGLRRYRLSVRGRAAHTGVEPWAGANAIVSLAGKVLDVDGLSDHDSGLSITVSRISGGTRVNIVPDVASAEIDVRVPDMPTAIEIDARLCDVAMREDIAGTTGELELFAERPPFVESASAGPAIDLYRQAAAALDMDHATGMTGGGSDGCFTSAAGVPTVDGLGPVGGGYHTDQEYVRLSTLAERAALTATVLGALELGSK